MFLHDEPRWALKIGSSAHVTAASMSVRRPPYTRYILAHEWLEIAAPSNGLISLSQERQVRPQENDKNRKDRFWTGTQSQVKEDSNS